MSNGKLIGASIDLMKIDKSRAIKGKNGAMYYNIDIWINDEPDQYGNHASVQQNQTKEERENKKQKVYLGNGKKLYGWGDAERSVPKQAGVVSSQSDSWDDEGNENVPF